MPLNRGVRSALVGSFCLVAAASCLPSQRTGSRLSADELEDQWTKREWISKAARVLGAGTHAISDERLEELVPLTKDQIVDELMKGAAYSKTLLDFLDYYGNLKGPNQGLSQNPDIREILNNYSFGTRKPVLATAAAIQRGGDFYTLFDQKIGRPQMPLVANGQNGGGFSAPLQGDDQPAPPSGLATVKRAREEALAMHDKVQKAFQDGGALSGCKKGFNQGFGGFALADEEPTDPPGASDGAGDGTSDGGTTQPPAEETIFLQSEVGRRLMDAGMFNESFSLGDDWYSQVQSFCSNALQSPTEGSAADAGPMIERMTKVRAKIELVFDHAAKYNMDVYDPKDLASVSFERQQNFFIDQTNGGFDDGERFPFLPWDQIPNSSTNFNRKRGAFMLRTYFCDDLTPISIVANDDHSDDAHGSNPGCQACHYKLDPMAGFFRNRMFFGNPAFVPEDKDVPDNLTFDDFLSIQGDAVEKYMKVWRAPEGSGRKWNVGYVRSATKPQLNSYGVELEDLYKIMKTAPEVKQCLVRRMAEYFIGKNQVFDGGWLEHLAKQIPNGEGAATSGKAVQGVVKALVLSNTFAEADPKPSECYDFEPGVAKSSLPCEVAWTIKTNCESCHKGEGALAGLDLLSWSKLDGGDGFTHLDDDGNQIPRMETFKRIKDRLETTDKLLRMPKNREMTAVDRARLFKWVDGQLNSASTGGTP